MENDWLDAVKLTPENMSPEAIDRLFDASAAHGKTMCLGVPYTSETMKECYKAYKCLRCGSCCTKPIIDKDKVYLSSDDIAIMAAHLGVSKTLMKSMLLHWNKNYYLLIPCRFYKNGCMIYEARPKNCRIFPFQNTVNIDGTEFITIYPCSGARTLVHQVFTILTEPQKEILENGAKGIDKL